MDFLSASEAMLQGLADPDVLRIAAEQDRILVTHDFKTMPRHFADFLQTYGSSPGPVIEELILIWTATDAEEWEGPDPTNSCFVIGSIESAALNAIAGHGC